MTVKEVLNQVEDKSEFIFLYKIEELDENKRVNVELVDASIQEILDEVLKEQNLTYDVYDRQVIIRKVNNNKSPWATTSAQNETISGKVTDSSGQPLPGVTVVVKGTTNGTITGFDGKYSLANIPSDATLIFSFVGMKTQEIAISGKTVVNVTMDEEAIGIEEVVAIGYGTVKKKDLTGAISSLTGEKLVARQTAQIGTALQGALPGVMVTRNNSRPGAGVTVRVRGITSLTSNDPLVIVDGVPTGSIDDVNPSDIESLTVLKDAASASIYGSRAAAGVILITTKRGVSGKENIEYDYSYSMNLQTKIPDYADAVTYMKVFNEYLWNDTPAGGEYTQYSKDLIDNYWTLNKQNPDQYPNTNWVDMCLRNFAPRQSHQLSIATGKENLRTNLSIGYVDEDGLLDENQSWKRMTARLNNNLTIGRWFSTTFDINLKREVNVNPAFDYFYRMRYEPPIFAGIYSDGRLAGGYNGTNVYGKMMYGGTDETSDNQVDGKISIDIKPLNGLTITGLFAPKYDFYKGKLFNKQVPYYSFWNDTKTTELLDGTETTDLKETRIDSYSLVSQAYINYVKSIDKHNLSVMLGYENYYYYHENVTASRGEYDFTYYPYLDAGPGNLKDNSGDAYEIALRSALGRLLYNWNSKYLLQANFRYDGSSRFHKDYRWGFFPSVSAGWVVSEENFMKNISMISHLKLRASWGQLGDQRIGNYPYQSTLSFNNPTLYVGNTVTSVQGASAYQYPIKDITWQTTETTGLGIDLNTFNNRLHFSGDYSWKQTKDMLLQLQIPTYLGYSDPYQNAGKMSTKGWDIDLAWNDKISDFHYGISFNISHYKSEMGYLKDTKVESAGTITREGSEYYEWYGYLSDGIYQTAEEVAGSPVTSSVVTVGDVRYKDISGPDGVPDGVINTTYDRVLLGGSFIPRLNYGGNINMGYRGIDFLLSFQGVGERKSMLTDEMVQPIRSDLYNVPEIILGKYWSKYNTDEQNANARYPRATRTGISNNYAVSDFWLINGAYFRIKNITLGYTLPKVWMGKSGIDKIRFYASLSDFFTISHFPAGWDPEVSSSNYPITKTITFGASVRF
ncbi:MAG TPA: hypothetical protein DD458_16510 [Prolixibacteraceae bacterium]|nr:hypothetical protein [Marinilabiliales bacterium]HBL76830.1 hypothetical protein [Prolixibacteraceae bacterium]HCU62789.1 hypothetical protein [Prolixibacteraceae bacterium]